MKHLRGYYLDGMTFGMEIETNTAAYRAMKKATRRQEITSRFGIKVNALVCPYQHVAGIMREAGWIVAERQSFRHITIDDGEEIFIEYPDGIHDPLRGFHL